ncbi:hypothetical protein CEXT_20271 [Caerostris extrusa]|uniref:Uncharacterized protein n=1 Tax=Caerostris extrusa TaxID=172846 RepID=A0AAV4TG40_CAEEX|nr:hypothetical protein CEXT_20271 [Caerostris extrusa]
MPIRELFQAHHSADHPANLLPNEPRMPPLLRGSLESAPTKKHTRETAPRDWFGGRMKRSLPTPQSPAGCLRTLHQGWSTRRS